jgi:8-oxo-dGTP diphosphatase
LLSNKWFLKMPVSDQGVSLDCYMLIPRVLIFVTRGNCVLLIKGRSTKPLWANKYNGIGGHVEPGEDIISAARRELLEETGLTADLRLCGTLVVDTGQNPGIGIFVFSGESFKGALKPSLEGIVEWFPFSTIPHLTAVQDLPVLLRRIRKLKHGDPPFHALSYYKGDQIIVKFAKE